MTIILTTAIFLLVLCVSSNPLVNPFLKERARGPGSIGPPNPRPLCYWAMDAPDYEDCGIAIRRSVQQSVRSDRTLVWDMNAVFEFYDPNLGPNVENIANAIPLPASTIYKNCQVILKLVAQSSGLGQPATGMVRSDKATWEDIREAALITLIACSVGHHPSRNNHGGSQTFGEFNAIEISLFAPSSPPEVYNLGPQFVNKPIASLDNNGVYDEEWNPDDWPQLALSSDDDDDEASAGTEYSAHASDYLGDRPGYVFQINTPEDLEAYCTLAHTFVYTVMVAVPQVAQIMFGLLEMLAPVLSWTCELK